MTVITFTGTGTLTGTGSGDGSASCSITFTPTGGSGGTNSCAPNGAALTNSAGTWTWGGVANGGYFVMLNGAIAGGNGAGIQLYLLNGDMYVLNNAGYWYKWASSYWLSVNPPNPLPPPCP